MGSVGGFGTFREGEPSLPPPPQSFPLFSWAWPRDERMRREGKVCKKPDDDEGKPTSAATTCYPAPPVHNAVASLSSVVFLLLQGHISHPGVPPAIKMRAPKSS